MDVENVELIAEFLKLHCCWTDYRATNGRSAGLEWTRETLSQWPLAFVNDPDLLHLPVHFTKGLPMAWRNAVDLFKVAMRLCIKLGHVDSDSDRNLCLIFRGDGLGDKSGLWHSGFQIANHNKPHEHSAHFTVVLGALSEKNQLHMALAAVHLRPLVSYARAHGIQVACGGDQVSHVAMARGLWGTSGYEVKAARQPGTLLYTYIHHYPAT